MISTKEGKVKTWRSKSKMEESRAKCDEKYSKGYKCPKLCIMEWVRSKRTTISRGALSQFAVTQIKGNSSYW